MYELDHMLNGKQSHLHHQELIQQAQYERIAQSIKPRPEKRKTSAPLRPILVTLLHLIGRA